MWYIYTYILGLKNYSKYLIFPKINLYTDIPPKDLICIYNFICVIYVGSIFNDKYHILLLLKKNDERLLVT